MLDLLVFANQWLYTVSQIGKAYETWGKEDKISIFWQDLRMQGYVLCWSMTLFNKMYGWKIRCRRVRTSKWGMSTESAREGNIKWFVGELSKHTDVSLNVQSNRRTLNPSCTLFNPGGTKRKLWKLLLLVFFLKQLQRRRVVIYPLLSHSAEVIWQHEFLKAFNVRLPLQD